MPPAEYQTAMRLNHLNFLGQSAVAYDCMIGLGQIASTQGHTDEAVDLFPARPSTLMPGLQPGL